MKEKYVVLGAGGHSKVVMDVLRLCGKEIVGLTDNTLRPGDRCMGCRVLGDDSVLDDLYRQGIPYAAMGIGHVGYPAIRNKVFAYALERGFAFPNLVHPAAILADSAKIGQGVFFGAGSIVNAEARIGDLCIINTGAVVEHEAVLGNGVHVAPHATVLGRVSVGENTLVGAGSVILQGAHVGKNCLIGAGSFVHQDVGDGCVVIGNPGRVMKRSDL